MKININKQSGILSLPQDFATLEDITSEGRYHYVIKYNVDALRAIRDRAFIVKIGASLDPPDVKDVAGFVRLNSQEVIQNLLTRQSERVEVNRAFTRNFIGTVTSDITSKIPNNKTKDLKSSRLQTTPRNYDDLKLTAEKFLFQKKTYQLAKASDLTGKNISQPTLQTPLFQPLGVEVTPVMPPQEHAYTLILQHGMDPSMVGARTTLIADTARTQAGVLQRPQGVARDVLIGTPAGSIRSSFGLLNLLLGEQKSKPTNQLGLATNDYTLVPLQENTNILTIEEDLYLNVSEVGDQFYLVFQLQDMDGVETESLSTIVHHARNLATFTLTTLPAFVSATQCPGYNRLEIKQVDPNGAGVFVYRKLLDTQTVITEADYVQIAKIPLRVQDGTKWHKDTTAGMRPAIYRVVSYNRAEIKSSEFSSVVVNPTQKVHMVKAKAHQKRLYLAMSAKVIDKTVQLELNDIPAGVLSMRVYRRDLSRHETLQESTQVGNVIFLPKLPSPNMNFYVTDTTPVDQRVYEYSALLVFRDGTELWSTAPVTIQYNPIINNVISTTSTPIKATNVGSELDVVFTLSSVIADGKIDQIKKAMDQQGILGFYQEDITLNRDLLQNLIGYQVKRTNLTTSEVEDMGVFIGTTFSDKAVGRNKGVKPIQIGHAYEYTITTHFRSAQSLLTTFTKTVTDATTPSKDYTYSPSKWQHPVTLKEGNLVSTTSLQRNHANSEFTFGTVGDILYLRISLALPAPSIHKATAVPLGKGKVMVQWELKGSSKQIDHFLVTKEEMGMRTVVGKAHALTDATNLQFIDTPTLPTATKANPSKNVSLNALVDTTLETAATYHVTPVLYDYSHGTAVKSPQVITKKLR